MATKSKATKTTPKPKSSRAPKSTKTTAPKKSRRSPRTKAPARTARRRQVEPTAVGRVASVLPGTLRDAEYVKRTIEVLDQRERKADRLNAQTKKQLIGIVEDLKGDVTGRIETERDAVKERVDRVVERARKTKVGRTVRSVPEEITKIVDRALDRVGLVRKDALLEEY